MQKLLTTKEKEKMIHVAPYTIFMLRQSGNGPKYLKLGRIIRYRMEDVNEWMKTWTKEKEYTGFRSISLDK